MADDTTTEETTSDDTETDDSTGDDGEGLGEGGKKALAEERRARRAAEKQAKSMQSELDKLRESTMSDNEKAIEAARAEARTEALQTANGRLLRAGVLTAAAGKLNDPEDAVRMLDLEQFSVDDDGNVDTKPIVKAIDELVKSKPYLGAGAKPGSLPGGGARPSQGTSMNDFIRQAAGRS